MTAALRKASERQRRKERGEVAVQVWLAPDVAKGMDEYARLTGHHRSAVAQMAIKQFLD